MGRWRGTGAAGLVVLAVGVAGCSGGAGAGSAARVAAADGITAATLKGALLTHINGVAAAGAVTSGKYAAVAQAGARGRGSVQVTPKQCGGTATPGFDPAALAGYPAAGVTFRVSANAVSEVLVASSYQSAGTALAARVPAGCARYREKIAGKTYTYQVTERSVSGVGVQARELNVTSSAGKSNDQWSLMYRGANFVGTVTVVGPNASDKAVQELAQQAYAYAAKMLPASKEPSRRS